MLTIPVQPIVIILEFSISPHVTITAGNGARSVPPFQVTFAISDLFLKGCVEHSVVGVSLRAKLRVSPAPVLRHNDIIDSVTAVCV